ncbi:MAG: PAS domain S-box protein, partial [Anaerolineae bacterium]
MSTPRAEDHEFRPLSGVGGSADHPAVRQPPLRLALIVAFAVFIAEAIVMVVLSFLGPLATRDAALIDAALLVVLLSPTIYFFLLRPVSLHIAGRQEAEERIEHLNAVLRAVRSVNQLIVREKDRARLVRGACESLIESRGCHTAWIALLTGDGQVLETAGAGLDGAFASMAERWRRGTQPTCVERALSNSDPVVIHDPSSVCGDCALAGKYAGRIGVSVRLEHEGKVYGVLAVSVPEEFAGDAEERSLLREVAQDVGFALRTIEREEERSQAQRAVRVSEERYRTIFETSGTAMAIIDSDTTIALANSEFEKLSGYTREELEDRKSWTEFVTEDDLDRMIEYHRLRRVDREAAPRRYDFRFLDRKGRLRDILLSIDMIPGTDRSVASLLDLTERKRAEEEIRRHLKRIRALLEIDRAITSSLDLDQVLDLVLERLQEVVAYDSAGVFLVADSRAKLTAGKGYPDREGALQVSFPVEQDPLAAQILSEKRPQVVADAQSDERFRGRGGAEYVRSWIGVPLVAKGRALGFLTIDHTEPGVYDEESAEMAQAFANHAAIAIDNAQSYQEAQRELLERQRTQLKLRESEARYRALFNNASEAIFIHDLEGKFLEVNDVACQRLGYSHEELLQMGLQDLAAREWDETDLPTKRLPEEEPVYWEMVHAGRDGRQIPVELSSRVIDYDGKESVLSIARDVSERREMEKQLRRQERLAAVGQLAGGIAHDFNNLLTTVVLYAAIALRRRDLPAGLEGSLETILEESQRASQLVDQILDFSRRSPMEKEPVDLLLNL